MMMRIKRGQVKNRGGKSIRETIRANRGRFISEEEALDIQDMNAHELHDYRKSKVYELKQKFMTDGEIARSLGIGKNTVRNMLTELQQEVKIVLESDDRRMLLGDQLRFLAYLRGLALKEWGETKGNANARIGILKVAVDIEKTLAGIYRMIGVYHEDMDLGVPADAGDGKYQAFEGNVHKRQEYLQQLINIMAPDPLSLPTIDGKTVDAEMSPSQPTPQPKKKPQAKKKRKANGGGNGNPFVVGDDE